MQSQIRLGRVFGIALGLHYSWFIIAALLGLSLSARFRMSHPGWSDGAVWLTAGVTAALFFVAILVHELSHALTARARGLPVGDITLFALGGVSRIQRDSEDATSEFLIGVVGPLTSAVIGLVCLGAAWVVGWSPAAGPTHPVQEVLVWLGYINFLLAAFNMIPGFPLDGGRVLRSIIWGITHDAERATRSAARIGQLVAVALIFWGMMRFFGGAGLGGLWLVFIGWFLLQAAGASYGRGDALELLRKIRASEVMSSDCQLLEPRTSIATFVSDHLLRTGRRCFLVGHGEQIEGLLTISDLKEVPKGQWDQTSVERVMKPLSEVRTVSPDTPASECFETMTSDDVHQLPVVDHGRIRGIVSRGELLNLLRTKAELGV